MAGRPHSHLPLLLPRLRRFARGLAGAAAPADAIVLEACRRALTTAPPTTTARMFGLVHAVWRDTATDTGEAVDAAAGPHFALGVVRRALRLLPAEQRGLLLLASVEGLSHRECAEALDLPVGTVTASLARARLTLGRLVEDPHDEPGAAP
jgi:RNA polymerase sigma-70 factor, ECF subfamily